MTGRYKITVLAAARGARKRREGFEVRVTRNGEWAGFGFAEDVKLAMSRARRSVRWHVQWRRENEYM